MPMFMYGISMFIMMQKGVPLFMKFNFKKGSETILLVDDEKALREIGKEMLKTLGYKVLTAPEGNEAVTIYANQKETIDMVILDMMMPGMDGGDTFDALKQTNSQVKVLLSSGYSQDTVANDILARGCNGFIQKPFRLVDLSEKLRSIFDT